MLDPLPIEFNEELHQYTWEPTKETMLWSISQVVSPRPYNGDPSHAIRGHSVHRSLETLISGQEVEAPEEYWSWTDALLYQSWFDEIDEVLALEARLAAPKRSIGGSCDGFIRKGQRKILYDLKTKISEESRRVKPYAQLGAYAELLGLHYRDHQPDEAWVIWSYPGGCDFEQLDLQQCRDSWEGAWIKHEARQELF